VVEGIDVDVAFGPASGHLAGVGGVEAPGGGEVGCEGDREEAPLARATADQRFDVGERLGAAFAGFDDHPIALDHEEPVGVLGIGRDEDRRVEVANRFQGRGIGARRSQQ
jgi:hypothetical protein